MSSWTLRETGIYKNWRSVASNSTGQYLVAIVSGGFIYTSTDYGANWTPRVNDISREWMSVASNSTGQYLVACVYDGFIYISTDYGANWTPQQESGLRYWRGAAFSSDGTKLVASVNGGFIYIFLAPPPPSPISNICFPAGTLITTDQGKIAIDQIDSEIHTIRNKSIIGITKTVTQDKYLVCFEKDSLGNNLPSEKTIMSKNHSVLYDGKMTQAKKFINQFENVKKIKYTGEILYNVLLEKEDKMMVNNLICETLHPENSIAKLYKVLQTLNTEEQHDLIRQVNEYAIKNKVYNSSSKKLTK